MNFVLKPPLLHIAQVKLATILWNLSDIREAISRFCILYSEDKKLKNTWFEIEDKVKEKIILLLLPEHLKKDILVYIKPIGIQILRWIEYHISLNITLPKEFYWKSHGTIDRKRTAEILVKDEKIDISERYKLSCIYCLENSIEELWSKMNEDGKKCFDETDLHELVVIWTHIMKEGMTSMRYPPIKSHLIDIISGLRLQNVQLPYQYGLKCAASFGNVVSAEYFFQKLTGSDVKEFTAQIVNLTIRLMGYPNPPLWDFIGEYSSETLLFLLSKLDNNQQEIVFREFPFVTLNCLLEWPWQFFFNKTSSVIGNYFPEAEWYNLLLHLVLDRVLAKFKYLNHQEIFEENWQKSPDVFKRQILKDTVFLHSDDIVRKLFKIRDSRSLRLIFGSATPKEKKLVIYSYNARDICSELIKSEDWGLLCYFIKECIASKKEMIEFKKHIEEVVIGSWSKDDIIKNTDKLYKCFQLFDDILCGFDKRKSVEKNDINRAKRLCSSGIC